MSVAAEAATLRGVWAIIGQSSHQAKTEPKPLRRRGVRVTPYTTRAPRPLVLTSHPLIRPFP